MLPRPLTVWIILAWCLIPSPASAQATRADYERANTLRQRTAGKVFKARVTPHWDANGAGFWYRNDLAGGRREFIRVDAVHGVRASAFDHRKLAAALAKAVGHDVPPDRLPIDSLGFDSAAKVLTFGAEGKVWQCNLPTY